MMSKIMASSLLFKNAKQRLTCLHRHLYSTSTEFRPRLLVHDASTTSIVKHVGFVQRLHTKVYDNELIEKRQINKFKDYNDVEQSISISQIPTKKHNREQDINNATNESKLESIDPADVFCQPRITKEDEGDRIEEEYTSRPTRNMRKLRTKEYATLIKEHLNAHNVKKAIDVLEIRMLREDRVKPENYIYNLLISGCAKAGYTSKAFKLFTKMRQRGLKVTGGTYTSLFNACANGPSASDGLIRANHLREIMLEKGFEPNHRTYNAMIKAYGRCNDPKTAYLLVDEMLEKKLDVTVETFNFLLQACAGDKEFGFRHCLLTWHKMVQRGLRPDYYTFGAVLRCVRDCGFGDLPTMQQVLQQILKNDQQTLLPLENNSAEALNEQPSLSLVASTENKVLDVKNEMMNEQFEIPNLLAPKPHMGNLISISEVKKPHERFLLLGGLNGFLGIMKQNNITPGVEMFTAMLEVIPPTNAAEKHLLTFIRKIGLKVDIDFFNILIKKRSMRFDYDGSREVLKMIKIAELKPDIVTYGVLALGCQTPDEARDLLFEMRNRGAMLRQGCVHKNFAYVAEILQVSLDEHIKPNDIFLRHLHNFYNQCARSIDARHPSTKTKAFKKDHAMFCDKLRMYYEELGIANMKLEDAIKAIRERPYDQFHDDNADGKELIKNEKLARKHKARKYIKKIKLANFRDDPPELISSDRRIE